MGRQDHLNPADEVRRLIVQRHTAITDWRNAESRFSAAALALDVAEESDDLDELRYQALKAFFRWMEAGREIHARQDELDRMLINLGSQPIPAGVIA